MPKNKDNEKIMKNNTTRVILNVPNDIAEEFGKLSVKRGITRSNMIIYAMSWYLDYNKSIDLMPRLLDTLKNVDNLSRNIEN